MSLEALLQTLGVQQPAPQPAPVPMQSRPAFDRYQSYAQPMQPQRPTLPRPPGSYLGGGGTPSPQTPPPGFTSGQWAQLLNLSKVNPAIKDLIDKYTQGAGGGTPGKPGTPKPPADPWRREMPTDTSQLMRQLSYNAGEMGMPGGYVGAVQIPAYGSTQPPVNNPDMTTYGQQPGIGEATYYMQSMNGGMAPIAAMSPLGVPAGWNPGGGGRLGYGQRMRLANSGMLGGGAGTFQPKSFDQTTEDLAQSMLRMGSGVGPDQISLFNAAFAPESNKSSSSSSMQKKKKTGSGSGNGGKPPKGNSGGGSSYKPPSKGVPISLPFGY